MYTLYQTMYLLWHLDVSIWPVHDTATNPVGVKEKAQ
ncbi:hypothetical protein PSFL107428_11295 [Pseudoalteromonas maricaloris]